MSDKARKYFVNEHLMMLILFGLLVQSIFLACVDTDVRSDQPIITLPYDEDVVTATIYARVLDENGQPSQNASINLLSAAKQTILKTDANGYILAENLKNKGQSVYLSVSLPGKFKVFKRFSLLPDRYNYYEIVVFEKHFAGSFNATNGGTVALPEGAEASFSEKSVIDQSGSIYEGEVQVAMSWIDPSSEDLNSRIIGDLSGIDTEGQFRSLITLGMLSVELFDNDGNVLDINDKGATLTFPVPEELSALAKPTIPLWSYNEKVGIWVQEGEAIRDEKTYKGKVYHFSSFNIDYPTDPIEIKGRVIGESSNGPARSSFFRIEISSDRIGRSGGWLCDDGSFRFYNLSKDEEFELTIVNNCGVEIFNETYGPFAQDHDLGDIQLSNMRSILSVSGNARDCDLLPLKNGRISVVQNDRIFNFPIDDQGRFEFGLDVCEMTESTITLIDLDNEKSFTRVLGSTSDIQVLSNLAVCEELKDYVSLEIGDEYSILLAPNVTFWTYLAPDLNVPIVSLHHDVENTYENSGFNMTIYTLEGERTRETSALSFRYVDAEMGVFDNEPPRVTITRYDTIPGGFFEGSFECEVLREFFTLAGQQIELDSTDITYVTGKFKVPIQ